jgi:ABC-type bacteriocin/lantibiotic exporter with double-glycine peptidase domain
MSSSRLAVEVGWIKAAPTPDIRQRSALDCGAAALAMLAASWHVDIALDDPAIGPPSKNGLRLGDLRAAARAHGLNAFAIRADERTLEHELRAGRPMIIGLLRPYSRSRGVSHYEVVVAMRGDEIVTLDPAAGLRVRDRASLNSEWSAAGFPALVVIGMNKKAAGTECTDGQPALLFAASGAGQRSRCARSTPRLLTACGRVLGGCRPQSRRWLRAPLKAT